MFNLAPISLLKALYVTSAHAHSNTIQHKTQLWCQQLLITVPCWSIPVKWATTVYTQHGPWSNKPYSLKKPNVISTTSSNRRQGQSWSLSTVGSVGRLVKTTRTNQTQNLFTLRSVTCWNEICFNTFYLISYLLQHLVWCYPPLLP